MALTYPRPQDDKSVTAEIDRQIGAMPTNGMRSSSEEHRYRPEEHRACWHRFASEVPHYSTIAEVERTVEVAWGEGESKRDIESHITSLGWTPNIISGTPASWDKDGLHIELCGSIRQGEHVRQGGYKMPGCIIRVWRMGDGPTTLIDPLKLIDE